MEDIYKELDAAADIVSDLPDNHGDAEEPDVGDVLENDADGLESDGDEEELGAEGSDLEGAEDEPEPGEELEPDDADEGGEAEVVPDSGNIEQLMEGLDPDDPKQNAIRSALGRMASTQRSLDALTQQVEALTQAGRMQPTPPVEDDEDDDGFIDSAKDVDKRIERYLQRKAAKDQQERANYTNGFLNSFLDYSQSSGLSKEEQSEIWSEIYDNPKYGKETGDPTVDCKINITKARATILERRLEAAKVAAEKKKPNVRGGGKPSVPLGAAPSSKRQKSKPSGKQVKLDPEAAAFIQSRGITEEKALEILSAEVPAQFSR